jgi:hypothetical protein
MSEGRVVILPLMTSPVEPSMEMKSRLQRRAAGRFQCRQQRTQGFLDVGLQRDLGAVVFRQIPVDQADLHHR